MDLEGVMSLYAPDIVSHMSAAAAEGGNGLNGIVLDS